MKYVLLLALAAISFDAMVMNGYYRNRAGHNLASLSDAVGESLWGRLS